jgi:hypothetical protein
MTFPPELLEHPDDTAVIGNIDDFIAYIESGQALQDWQQRIAAVMKELEELF